MVNGGLHGCPSQQQAPGTTVFKSRGNIMTDQFEARPHGQASGPTPTEPAFVHLLCSRCASLPEQRGLQMITSARAAPANGTARRLLASERLDTASRQQDIHGATHPPVSNAASRASTCDGKP